MGRRLSGMPLAALALLVAGTLGACESEEPPMASPSPTASPTASPSPSAMPTPSASASSDIPAAAREKSEKGAEAFVRYFFDQVNAAWTTPRAGMISSLSEPVCDFCVKTEDTAVFLVKEGQRYASDPVSLRSLDALSGAPVDQRYFYCELTQNRSNIVEADGTVVTIDPHKDAAFNVAAKWDGHGWAMLGVENAQ